MRGWGRREEAEDGEDEEDTESVGEKTYIISSNEWYITGWIPERRARDRQARKRTVQELGKTNAQANHAST